MQGRFQIADSALSSAATAMTRANTLAVEGANGTMSDSDRQALAEEVQGILQQMLSLANTSYQGAHLCRHSGQYPAVFPRTRQARFRTVVIRRTRKCNCRTACRCPAMFQATNCS